LIWSLLSRLSGVKVVVLGIGWDDLSTRLGKRFAFAALRLAQYRSFRDNGTVSKLCESGIRVHCDVCPDPAFGLEPQLAAHPENTPAVIMVCPIAAKAWLEKADSAYEKYQEKLILCCMQWLREGYTVKLASSQTLMDTPIARQMFEKLRVLVGEDAPLQLFDVISVPHYLQLAREADVVVASRLHAVILSAVSGTPPVAISPTRKLSQLMTDMGLSTYCLNLPHLQAADLLNTVSDALGNERELRKDLDALLARYRRELTQQYQNIGLLLKPDVTTKRTVTCED
jgi:polysaccharide pyruvyl transferase WcaK-like protein